MSKGIGYTTARAWARSPVDALPAILVAGRYHVDFESADRWLDKRAARRSIEIGALVDQLVSELEAKRAAVNG